MSVAPDAQCVPANAGRPPYLAIAMVAGVSLAFEIVLIRLLSIIQWHHFAAYVISIALLGIGASGTAMTLARNRLAPAAHRWLPALILAFALSVWLAFQGAQRVPLNFEALFWDARQWPALAAVSALLAVPFFLSGLAICLSFVGWPAAVARLYAADLTGAGCGALAALGLLATMPAAHAPAVLAGGALLACLVAAGNVARGRRRYGIVVAVVAIGVAVQPGTLTISPYKPLAQWLQASGSRVIATADGPRGAVHVVANDTIPLRHAPGLSLFAPAGPPRQLAVFVDADALSAVDRFDGRRETVAYLDALTSAAPYHIVASPRVAVLGAGTGTAILQAAYHDARSVAAVEPKRRLVATVAQLADWSGDPYALPGVTWHAAEPRAFLAATADRFDVIQLSLALSTTGATATMRSLTPRYLLTVEALEAMLDRLAPSGLVALTAFIDNPPRELPRLIASVAAVLERRGVTDPGRHVALVTGLQTGTILVGNEPIGPERIAALASFCADRAFELTWPPVDGGDAQPGNDPRSDYLGRATAAWLGKRGEAFASAYKFDLSPTTDDRPFFGHFAKPATFAEIWRLRYQGAMAIVEWGYLVAVVQLVQAVVLGLLLIAVPLALRRHRSSATRGTRAAALTYFTAIGIAFLLIEIATLEKLGLVLGDPVIASATALAAFLVFAGLGSLVAGRLARGARCRPVIAASVAGIWLAAVALVAGIDAASTWMADWPIVARLPVVVALVAPAATCMGVPFAAAVTALGENAPGLVPWAWAINGCASVVAAVLAGLVAARIGFSGVVAVALVLYLVAAFAVPGTKPHTGG